MSVLTTFSFRISYRNMIVTTFLSSGKKIYSCGCVRDNTPVIEVGNPTRDHGGGRKQEHWRGHKDAVRPLCVHGAYFVVVLNREARHYQGYVPGHVVGRLIVHLKGSHILSRGRDHLLV